MTYRHWQTLTAPLTDANPVTVQILGICSALAVTTSMQTAVVMSVAVTAVLALSGASISMIRRHVPHAIRLIIEITIIASLVIITDQLIKAFAFETGKQLSIFVGLIITNCIILGRAEGFALRHPPLPSFLDGIGNGLGYSAILLSVGAVREILGKGEFFGIPLASSVDTGGWFVPVNFMLLPPSAFFVIGLIVWAVRSWKPDQVEESEFNPHLHEER